MSEAVAKAAARLWGLPEHRVQLAARRENSVYHVDHDAGYALRLHREGYRSDAQLVSELRWMAALEAQGMQVPRPIPSRSGLLVERVEGVQVDVLTWLPGQMLGKQGALDGVRDRGALVHQLGGLLAQLHDISDAWVPDAGFTRPRWDAAGLVGDQPLWDRFWLHPDLTASETALFLAARDQARLDLAALQAPDFGLIHADAITENLMLHEGRLSLIDFDDGGFGYRDFDVATFLFRQIAAPDYVELRTALLDGYSPRRHIDAQSLDLFLMLRSLTYPGWIIARLHEPGGAERSVRAIAQALPLAWAYLEGST